MALLVLISLRMMRDVWSLCMQSDIKSCCKHFCALRYILVRKIYCGSSKMEQLLTQQNFHVSPQDNVSRSGTSPCPPAYLAMQHQTTSSGVTVKKKKPRSSNIVDLKQRILECIQVIPKEMLKRVLTVFSSRMQKCFERHSGQLQSVTFKQ